MTRRTVATLAIVPALAVTLAVAATAAAAPAAPHHGATGTRAAFHDAMRKLWEDHITWTRGFIVSAATQDAGLADLQPTVDRLLANQPDLGNAIKPFYGDAAGDRLTALLREHIVIAADLVGAAKAGDADATQDASDRWYANADEIADFLSAANPKHWPQAEMRSMMRSHLDLTLAEAVARLQGRYADDIAAYEQVHLEILEMADMLSDGIVAQFPGAFAR